MRERRFAGLLVLALVAGAVTFSGQRGALLSHTASAAPQSEAAPSAAAVAEPPAPARIDPPVASPAAPAARGPETAPGGGAVGRAIPPRTVRPSAPPAQAASTIRQIAWEEAPVVAARHVEIVDEATGRVLYEKNARARIPVASVTKIMTALVALERADPRERVTVQYDGTELVDSTLMGCLPGDVMSLEDLLYGLMLPSGNDAALAIAEHVAGSKARFVDLMNERAAELGMVDTHFANPHGLDVLDHYSSAHDMVVLSRQAMRLPAFRSLAAARQWTVRSNRGAWEIYNLNRLLWQYPGTDGIKIGYEDRAGKTMVASATRDGHRVYIALMNTQDLVADARPLFDWVFRNFTWEPAQ